MAGRSQRKLQSVEETALAAVRGGGGQCDGHVDDFHFINGVAQRYQRQYGTPQHPPRFPNPKSPTFAQDYEAFPRNIQGWGRGVRYQQRADQSWGWLQDCLKKHGGGT